MTRTAQLSWLLPVALLTGCDVVERVHRPLHENFEAVGLDGTEMTLESFRGKPWLVAVWMPGCGSCIKEFGDVQAVANAWAGPPVGFLALSVHADTAPVRRWAERIGLTIPVAILKQLTLEDLKLKTVPATFFLDADANVVAIANGGRSRGFLERRLEELTRDGVTRTPER